MVVENFLFSYKTDSKIVVENGFYFSYKELAAKMTVENFFFSYKETDAKIVFEKLIFFLVIRNFVILFSFFFTTNKISLSFQNHSIMS